MRDLKTHLTEDIRVEIRNLTERDLLRGNKATLVQLPRGRAIIRVSDGRFVRVGHDEASAKSYIEEQGGIYVPFAQLTEAEQHLALVG